MMAQARGRGGKKATKAAPAVGVPTPARPLRVGDPDPPAPTANAVLRALGVKALNALLPDLERVEMRIGDLLHEARERVDHIYYPLNGIASIVADSASLRPEVAGVPPDAGEGRIVEVGTIGATAFVGMPLLLGSQESPFRVIGQSPGQMLRLPTPRFRSALEEQPRFRDAHTRAASALLHQMGRNAVCNVMHPLSARCARWLLLASDHTRSDLLRLTHLVLSQMLGVHRPAVTAVLGEFAQRGTIRLGRGGIMIMDRPGLEAAACPCYFAIRDEERRQLPD